MSEFRFAPRSFPGLLAVAMLTVCLAMSTARAQVHNVETEPERVTFEQAVEIALEQNNELRRSRNSLELDRLAVSDAKWQFSPDLRLGASGGINFGRTFSESEGRILSSTNRSFSTSVSSSVTLFDGFGREANLKAASLDLDAGVLDDDRVRQTVVFLVIGGYLQAIEAEAQVGVAEETLAAQRDQLGIVRTQVDAGRSPISDLYQQEATVARAELTLVTARRALELARIDLVRNLQLDPMGTYAFDAPELPDTTRLAGPMPTLSGLLPTAFEYRSDLIALETRLEASRQDQRVAASGYWPTLSLSGRYGSSYSSGSSDRDFMQQLDDRRSGSVGLGLSFPIFDRFTTKRSVDRARIQTDNVLLTLSDLRQTVAFEVRRALLDELSAREGLRAARAQLTAAERALGFTEQRYEAGASTLYEVTLSRATLTDAQSAWITAAYTLLWQRHVRDYYVGVLDPGTELFGTANQR